MEPMLADSEEEFVRQVDAFFTEYIFGYIYRDIEAAINAKANYLVALGLVAYTEFMGGLVAGTLGQSRHSKERFYKFFDLLGPAYKSVRQKREVTKVYTNIRCGLAHAYFIDQDSVVKMSADEFWGKSCGIEVGVNGEVYFVVERYWQDFQVAARSYHQDLVTRRDPKSLALFREAVGEQWHFKRLAESPTLSQAVLPNSTATMS
jgi:hypothetical protein